MNAFKEYMSKLLKLLALTTLFTGQIMAQDKSMAMLDLEEKGLNNDRREECELFKKYYIKDQYQAECYTNYQLFGDTSKYSSHQAKKGLRVAGFNIWNLGYNQTKFKDLKVVAGMMNKWDVIGTVEIIPIGGTSAGGDEYNNKNIAKFLLTQYGSASEERKAEVLSQLRIPGYLELLKHLRARDNSWSLILSPRELGAAGLREMTGYFFRASKVKLNKNEYCEMIRQKTDGIGYACVPYMNQTGIMDKDYRVVFSKRPFMASFKSHNFDFTMLAIHTKFRKPDNQTGKKILRLVYGVDDYKEVDGLNGYNYYRFAETMMTIEFIKKMKEKFNNEQDYIFVGDFNLNGDESFWTQALQRDPGTQLYVKENTSVSESLFDSRTGKPTNGRANNYDHFIFNPKLVKECDGDAAKVEDFYQGTYASYMIDRTYKVRSDYTSEIRVFSDTGEFVSIEGFPILSSRRYKITRHIDAYTKELSTRKMINTSMQVVEDPIPMRSDAFNKFKATLSVSDQNNLSDRDIRIKYYVSELKRRVYETQQIKESYYAFYKETLSDHLPIYMNCSTTDGDDD